LTSAQATVNHNRADMRHAVPIHGTADVEEAEMSPSCEAAVAASATQRPDPDTTAPAGAEHVFPVSRIPEAIRTLRHRVRTVLTDYEIEPDAVDDALLVISELATNAIEHALPPAELRLSLAEVDGCRVLHIEISDAGPAPRPSSGPGRPDSDENGRGLGIVAALSLRLGTRADPGRTVRWADLPTSPLGARPFSSTAEGTGM
jgi:anti-sigma regulatory factor (Ser/Thr protein kinase)